MAFRDSVRTSTVTGAQTIAVAWPTVVAHDRVLLFAVKDDTGVTWAAVTGFTQIATQETTAHDGQTYTLWEKKDATGAESGTITLDAGTGEGGNCTAIMVSLSGRNNTAALDFATATKDESAGATPISMAAASGTASQGADLLAFFAVDQSVAADVWNYTAPSGGWAEQEDGGSPTWTSATLDTLENVSAGAVGTVTGTATRTAGTGVGDWGAFIVAVPVAAAAAATKPRRSLLGVGF